MTARDGIAREMAVDQAQLRRLDEDITRLAGSAPFNMRDYDAMVIACIERAGLERRMAYARARASGREVTS